MAPPSSSPATPILQQTQQFLSSVLSQRGPSSLPYTEDVKWLIRQHLLSFCDSHPSLRHQTATFTHNDGRSVHLLRSDGTVPMVFQNVTYRLRMGGCFSTHGESVSNSSSKSSSNSALVILASGELQPYSTPVYVSDVLQTESATGFFVCNSDNLCYDEHITPLDAQNELDAGQIYFVLPVSKLRYRLSASDMAALTVKASVALDTKKSNSKRSNGRKNNRSKISPFVVMESSNISVIVDEEAQSKRLYEKQQALGVSRSGSIRNGCSIV